MNSVLSLQPTKQLELEPFSNFQDNASSSSLNSNETSKSDTNYWINYYNQQKIKEKEEKKHSSNIQLLKNRIQYTESNPNRKLIFSRPYKKIDSKEKKLIIKSKAYPSSETPSSLHKQSSEVDQINYESTIQTEVNQQNANQIDQQMTPSTTTTAARINEMIISPLLSSTYLRSMQHTQMSVQQQQKKDDYNQQFIMAQLVNSTQISPIESTQHIKYKQSLSPKHLRSIQSLMVGSHGNISSNNNISSSYTNMQSCPQQGQYSSEGDISRKVSFCNKINDSTPNQKKADLQCFHVNKLKINDSQFVFDLQKNMFSKNQLFQSKAKNQTIYPISSSSLLNQSPQHGKSIHQTNQNNGSVSKLSNIQSSSMQPSQQLLEKTMMNFQQQKLMTSLKYQSFMQGINTLNQNGMSFHNLVDNNKQQAQQSDATSNSTGGNLLNLRSQTSPTELKANYQDSFIELGKDQVKKIFMIEGYNQQSKEQRQFNIQNINVNENLKQSFSKNRQLTQASFFNEGNKQNGQNVQNGNNIISQQNITIASKPDSNINANKTSITRCQSGNRYTSKQITSTNTYNRKLYSNYVKQDIFISSKLESQITLQDEQQKNNQIQQNNNNLTRMRQDTKSQGFNLIEGIQILNDKILQGSQSTTATQSLATTNVKHTHNQLSGTPKIQKNFQVLYKICNKNILNAGLKEQKSPLYQINTNSFKQI